MPTPSTDPFFHAVALVQRAGVPWVPATPPTAPRLARVLPVQARLVANALATALSVMVSVGKIESVPVAAKDLADAMRQVRAAIRPLRGPTWWRAWQASWRARRLALARPTLLAAEQKAFARARQLSLLQQALVWTVQGLEEWGPVVNAWKLRFPEHAEVLQEQAQQVEWARASVLAVRQRVETALAAEQGLARQARQALGFLDGVRQMQEGQRLAAWNDLERRWLS